MTYYVTALTNDKAQLIAEELRTSDIMIAVMAKAAWEKDGYKVTTRQEG